MMIDLEVCKQVFPDILWKHVDSAWVGVTGAHGIPPALPMYTDERSWLKNSYFEILEKDGLYRVYFYFNIAGERNSIQSDDKKDLKVCLSQVKAKLQKIALDFSELSGLTYGAKM